MRKPIITVSGKIVTIVSSHSIAYKYFWYYSHTLCTPEIKFTVKLRSWYVTMSNTTPLKIHHYVIHMRNTYIYQWINKWLTSPMSVRKFADICTSSSETRGSISLTLVLYSSYGITGLLSGIDHSDFFFRISWQILGILRWACMLGATTIEMNLLLFYCCCCYLILLNQQLTNRHRRCDNLADFSGWNMFNPRPTKPLLQHNLRGGGMLVNIPRELENKNLRYIELIP